MYNYHYQYDVDYDYDMQRDQEHENFREWILKKHFIDVDDEDNVSQELYDELYEDYKEHFLVPLYEGGRKYVY